MSSNESQESVQNEIKKRGWLYKWTNCLKGYKKRWFVVSNDGTRLSYYKNQNEIDKNCRGTISLNEVQINAVDSHTFVILNNGTQNIRVRANNEEDLISWINALEIAKNTNKEENNSIRREELEIFVRDLTEKLENLRTSFNLLKKQEIALKQIFIDVESSKDPQYFMKALNEFSTLFCKSSTSMVKVCEDFLITAHTQGLEWSRAMQQANERKLQLEDMVEEIARQHSNLEQAAVYQVQKVQSKKYSEIHKTDKEDEISLEFFDARDTSFIFNVSGLTLLKNQIGQRDLIGTSSESEDSQTLRSSTESSDSKNQSSLITEIPQVSNFKRRLVIPNRPKDSLNLWSFIKNCIGKDLAKVPMPVNFSEPLSILQRLTEDYEYAELLDKAAQAESICEQLAYVAAFTVSSYSSTVNRTGKPFNPLLGETYECDRSIDLGWRCISEQVSHHPPITAQYCEGRKWRCWQDFKLTTKFRGKYIEVIPLGSSHVEFTESGNKFSWRKMTTTINNIIVGKLWIDNYGDMEIIGEQNAVGCKCHLKFLPYSYFASGSQRKVKGVVMDPKNHVKHLINGSWDNKIEIASVTSTSETAETPVYKTSNFNTIWQRRSPPEHSEKFYNFTTFACQLNEPEENVAPTDSRLRPDQRLMEIGDWDKSNSEKQRLEEEQRQRRWQRNLESKSIISEDGISSDYQPAWFKKVKNEENDDFIHIYQGEYWECKEKQDWSRCPKIF
ncbi:hypothetical protein PVAND_013608 [Polypedilum vanderplanki]|uniref:Oxysterol-binding protein n=1 Tax=Polypedilum vanderplanki TaxID=319348 RepID=A0A9J6CQU1_POLVA|nr:hypothetical protein PVAND_013608 [Polypedilum vanderplanki]